MDGSCTCGNLFLRWPGAVVSDIRACQCSYCVEKNAAYASDPAHPFSLSMLDPSLHSVVHNGTGTAEFHECGHCGDLVCVTWSDHEDTYGVVNARCLRDVNSLSISKPICFDSESEFERLDRRRRNWCSGVSIRLCKPD